VSPDSQPRRAIGSITVGQLLALRSASRSLSHIGVYGPSLMTFSGGDGTVRGYLGLLERYRKSYPDRAAMGKLDFSGLEIRILAPDAALVLGHWHLERAAGDAGGVFTLVFRRFPTGWRIIHDHTSVQKQTP